MKHPFVLAFILALALGLGLAQEGDGVQEDQDDRSLAEIIATHPDLTMFHEILRDTDLLLQWEEPVGEAVDDAGVQSSDAGVTVFAPSNAALEALSDDELEAFRADPESILLAHHVEQEPFTLDELVARPISEEFTYAVERDDAGTVTINGATIIEGDLTATNGIVHIIDTVLATEVVDEADGAAGAEGAAADEDPAAEPDTPTTDDETSGDAAMDDGEAGDRSGQTEDAADEDDSDQTY